MDYDRQQSRLPLSDKVHKDKAVPIGAARDARPGALHPLRALHALHRRDHEDAASWASSSAATTARSSSLPGKPLDNPYSMNVVDICPVGALTSRDFRFKARVWYLERTDVRLRRVRERLQHRDLPPRGARSTASSRAANPEVNDYWMCDAGRLSWGGLQGEGRLLEVLVRGDQQFVPADWPGAVAGVGARLRELAATGPGAVAFVVSAHASNEEIALVRRLGQSLGAMVAGVSWSPPGSTGDDFLIKADKNPNTNGLAMQGLATTPAAVDEVLAGVEAGRVKALVLVRTDLTRWVDTARAERALEAAPYVVVVDTDGRPCAQYANVVLPIGTYAESDGTFTNHARRVQRFRQAVALPGQARHGWAALADLVADAGGGPAPASAADVFAALAAEGGAFAGLDYERIGGAGAIAANARASA